MNCKIKKRLNESEIYKAAKILSDSLPTGYPDLQEAKTEITDIIELGGIICLAEHNVDIVGFGGLLKPIYSGRVFELHPLVVREDRRGQGIGRNIVFSA
ncbi:MAG: GNAT family N-acetyltransferase [Clostridia bacterium]|nr:GNAT family N-acetyltransferase [Clostridia bacterium]